MGLLDYYRQFDDMSDAEVSERLLRKRDEERAKALAHIPLVDLAGTEWPDFPYSEVMNASIYVWRVAPFLKQPAVFYPDTRLFEMPEERSVDIDSDLDFMLVELLLRQRLAG